MTRFFVEPGCIRHGQVVFGSDDSHHIAVVLKMRSGDPCVVLDDTGAAYECVLDAVAKNRTTAYVTAQAAPLTEPPVHITVAQALPKMLDKLEWVLQHGTEAGASAFLVFSSARARAEAGRFDRKLPRWNEIVKTAAEQSERARRPSVAGIITLNDVLKSAADYDLALLAYERETTRPLRAALTGSPKRVLVIVGPEGGFTDEEVSAAEAAGVATVSLGPRILRTETAALVMTAQILFALGE